MKVDLVKYKGSDTSSVRDITLSIKAPVALHSQMLKQIVGFTYNNIHRNYVCETLDLFIPEFREVPKSKAKQGSGDLITTVKPYSIHEENGEKYRIDFSSETQESIRNMYRNLCKGALDLYNVMIKPVNQGGLGIDPEQAKLVLPQGMMAEWVITGTVYDWALFYNLRNESHTQKEICNLAEKVGEIIEPLFPKSWKSFTRS